MSTEPKTIGDDSIVDLTKREAFAMHVMAGFAVSFVSRPGSNWRPDHWAAMAAAAADALIAELAKGPPR